MFGQNLTLTSRTEMIHFTSQPQTLGCAPCLIWRLASDPQKGTKLEMRKHRSKTQRSQNVCFVHQSVTNLDEGGAAEEEPKHVCHDVIADHTGDWDDEPRWEKNQTIGKCQDQTTPRLK